MLPYHEVHEGSQCLLVALWTRPSLAHMGQGRHKAQWPFLPLKTGTWKPFRQPPVGWRVPAFGSFVFGLCHFSHGTLNATAETLPVDVRGALSPRWLSQP